MSEQLVVRRFQRELYLALSPEEPVGLAPPGRGHESGGARAHRVAEAVEDERWERTPRESFSISLAAQCRAQA